MPDRTPSVLKDSLHRRAFVTGGWVDRAATTAPPEAEIASVLVQVRPERMPEVEAAIEAIAGCEIHGRDPRGKLVVVIEAPGSGAIGATLNTIALSPHVISASLVYHAIDAG